MLHFHVLVYLLQFFYEPKARREEIAAEVYEDEMDLRRSASYLNNSFCSAWSERSMDPDDFQVKSHVPSHLWEALKLQHAVKMRCLPQKDIF